MAVRTPEHPTRRVLIPPGHDPACPAEPLAIHLDPTEPSDQLKKQSHFRGQELAAQRVARLRAIRFDLLFGWHVYEAPVGHTCSMARAKNEMGEEPGRAEWGR